LARFLNCGFSRLGRFFPPCASPWVSHVMPLYKSGLLCRVPFFFFCCPSLLARGGRPGIEDVAKNPLPPGEFSLIGFLPLKFGRSCPMAAAVSSSLSSRSLQRLQNGPPCFDEEFVSLFPLRFLRPKNAQVCFAFYFLPFFPGFFFL